MTQHHAYLFDMDGTLVNSEPLKGKAIAMACEEYGVNIDYHIYQAVMGQNWDQVTQHFFEQGNIQPPFDEFNVKFRAHYERLLNEQLTLNPGAREYLESLAKQSKSLALVSSAARWMVEHILQQLELTHLFSVMICREDVQKHKPDPEAYVSALKQLGVDASQAIIFEDSAAGIEAGVAAGCEVIAIAHDFNGSNDFSKAKQTITDFALLM
ncbi:HAD-IA family hydrolase [Vibrio sp. CAIM 722]|uniref:HAD-IA family hydrolase n=1 Tax=Vibrio eleionomae TaxID=2653505 RepID=A0A7X4LNQ5_9VIBR|nr:HAD family phosphatase [Vibrio eleionomae]MZI95327.1 HAD-IA family hydrolase [Vibrio eleionomae]